MTNITTICLIIPSFLLYRRLHFLILFRYKQINYIKCKCVLFKLKALGFAYLKTFIFTEFVNCECFSYCLLEESFEFDGKIIFLFTCLRQFKFLLISTLMWHVDWRCVYFLELTVCFSFQTAIIKQSRLQ